MGTVYIGSPLSSVSVSRLFSRAYFPFGKIHGMELTSRDLEQNLDLDVIFLLFLDSNNLAQMIYFAH